MSSGRGTRPYLEKTLPEAGKAATAHATALSEQALRQGQLAPTANHQSARATTQQCTDHGGRNAVGP
jgi:hypothetical protein